MDIDALAKRFAKYEPMLEEMLVGYKEYQAEKAVRLADEPVVDEALHAAIHAPLHESDEAVAARAEQAKANDDHADAAQAELDEANAILQKEADAKVEADRLHVEAEAKAKADDERLKAGAGAAEAETDRKAAETGDPDLTHVALVEDGQQPDPNAVFTQEPGPDAAAAGQNQGQDAANGSAGGNAPENAGEASQRAPLAELDASGSDAQHKAPEEQPKG